MKTLNSIFLFFLSLFFAIQCLGQNEAQIKVNFGDLVNDSVFFYYDKYYLNDKFLVKTAYVIKGNVTLKLQVEKPGVYTMQFRGRKTRFFLEPGYNFAVTYEGFDMTGNTAFAGKGGEENKLYNLFDTKYQQVFNPDNMKAKAQSSTIDQFEDQLFEDKNNMFSLYKVFPGRASLSVNLLKHLEAEVTYSYYRWILSYPFHRANSDGTVKIQPLPSSVSEIFDEGQFSNDNSLLSETYREFILAYIKYKTMQLNSYNEFPSFTQFVNKQNQNASTLLKNNTYFFWLSKTVYNECEKIQADILNALYKNIQSKDAKGEAYKFVFNRCTEAAKKKSATTPEKKNPATDSGRKNTSSLLNEKKNASSL